MPPKAQKSKAAKLLAATSASKSKGKKKWSKGKAREKKNYRVVFNKALLDKLLKEVPKKLKVITVYTLVENYKINGSLARRAIRELAKQGQIRPVALAADHQVWTKAGADKEEKAGDDGEKGKKGASKKPAPKKEKAKGADDKEAAEDAGDDKPKKEDKKGDKPAPAKKESAKKEKAPADKEAAPKKEKPKKEPKKADE